MATVTNETKNTAITVTNENKPTGGTFGDNPTRTFADGGTFGQPGTFVKKEDKNSEITVTNENKN